MRHNIFSSRQIQEEIRDTLKDRKMTMQELADKTARSRATISRMLTGTTSRIDLDLVLEACKVLDLRMSFDTIW